MLKKSVLKRIDWPVSLFLFLVPLTAVVTLPFYLYHQGWNWGLWIFAAIFAVATEMSITAGYHRLFAHRSYEAHPIYRAIVILFSTCAWQSSLLDWCSGHREHHKHIDKERDPYAITKGFWFAHMGWMLLKKEGERPNNTLDLEKDPLIRFQHKYYVPLALATGFGVPTLIGYFMGDVWGGLLVGGFLRIAVTQQFTFFVNSLCHTLGNRPYSNDITARDSFFVAILTQGEGYHNYHHRFEADYRNGIKWFQWDPTKWLIYSLSLVGLTRKLRRMPKEEILKAQLQVDALHLSHKGFSQEKLDQLRERILAASQRMKTLQAEYKKTSIARYELEKERMHERHEHAKQQLAHMKLEMKLAKIEFKYAVKQWRVYLRSGAMA